MKQELIVRRGHWQAMREHVDRHVPLEACGLLAGRQDLVEKVIPVSNQAQSDIRFVLEPHEQLQAFDWIGSHDMELLGIFHSHPNGPDTVSPTDIAEAAYKVVHLIWSRKQGSWRARGFWIEDGSATEVSLKILD
jgi:proteasome lid subunit RPN8/RPN11